HIPGVLLTSPNEPFDQARASAAGAVGWIAKPFQTSALLEQVKKAFTTKPLTTQPAPVRPAPTQAAPEPTPGPPTVIVDQRIPTEVPPVRVPTVNTAISPALRADPPPPPPDISIP